MSPQPPLQGRSRVLLVTPLEKELRALEAAFRDGDDGPRPAAGAVPAFRVEALGVWVAAAGHGKAQCALVTQHLIDTAGPFGAVVLAGAAGALHPALKPGDVVLGTEAVEHDYTPRFHGPAPPLRHPASGALLAEIQAAQPVRTAFSVRTGPIAGGDEDVIDPARAEALQIQTGALCVAWEGPGAARAAAFSGLPFVEVRAVTDAADAAAPQSYRLHLAEAVGHAGAVVRAWLERRRDAARA